MEGETEEGKDKRKKNRASAEELRTSKKWWKRKENRKDRQGRRKERKDEIVGMDERICDHWNASSLLITDHSRAESLTLSHSVK